MNASFFIISHYLPVGFTYSNVGSMMLGVVLASITERIAT